MYCPFLGQSPHVDLCHHMLTIIIIIYMWTYFFADSHVVGMCHSTEIIIINKQRLYQRACWLHDMYHLLFCNPAMRVRHADVIVRENLIESVVQYRQVSRGLPELPDWMDACQLGCIEEMLIQLCQQR